MRVLIVKMSSMGDVIHTLPALTDAMRARPELRFDWVVEEGFAEIPAWHPAVNKVIPVALRRWRRSISGMLRSGEFRDFRHELRRVRYDRIIDAQGLMKSGIITTMARGPSAGLSADAAREPAAAVFYGRRHAIARDLHAVTRVRRLFAETLGYTIDETAIDYGIRQAVESGSNLSPAPEGSDYLMLLHGTTWPNKLWPEPWWHELVDMATGAGYRVLVPWSTDQEHERALRLTAGRPSAQMLDRQSLSGMAAVIAGARGVVAVDTGLAHLAAALDVPAVVLYGPTDPALAGTLGRHQSHLTSTLYCAPCLRRECLYRGEAVTGREAGRPFNIEPPCFADHPPAAVLDRLQALIGGRTAAAAGTVP